ncbi:MAG: type I-A CRISPR-associated protein Cas4/Csa1 [Firmicutes bacterium]|nr:type I-A CRISPR-associated protein Cas4/Csa1 [Bacillota bacterium]
MYFLTDEERQRLLKGILPKSRSLEIAQELRGWNWHQPPLEPVYDIPLAVYEIAGKYCSTGRDIYLRRIQHLRAAPNKDMIMGSAFHETLASILVRAKRLIYLHGVDNLRQILKELPEPPQGIVERRKHDLSTEDCTELERRVSTIHEFEVARLSTRIQDTVAKQPYIKEDSLVATAIPVMIEQRLDGSFLGLSQMLSADAFVLPEPMIMDLKYGEPRQFHKLGTAGYALVMESLYEYPVNLGCVVYLNFNGDRITVSKDIHIIDDELRQRFMEERDQKARMIYEEIDPGVAKDCYPACPFRKHCK